MDLIIIIIKHFKLLHSELWCMIFSVELVMRRNYFKRLVNTKQYHNHTDNLLRQGIIGNFYLKVIGFCKIQVRKNDQVTQSIHQICWEFICVCVLAKLNKRWNKYKMQNNPNQTLVVISNDNQVLLCTNHWQILQLSLLLEEEIVQANWCWFSE